MSPISRRRTVIRFPYRAGRGGADGTVSAYLRRARPILHYPARRCNLLMRNFRSNATFCKMICHAQRRGIVVVYFSFPAHPLGPRYGMRKLVAISLATCLPNRHRSGTIRTCRRNNKKKKKTVIRYFFFYRDNAFFRGGKGGVYSFRTTKLPRVSRSSRENVTDSAAIDFVFFVIKPDTKRWLTRARRPSNPEHHLLSNTVGNKKSEFLNEKKK